MVGDCRTIAIAPSSSNVIYAGGASSAGQPWLFKTTDAGVTWDTLAGLGADTTLRALAVHPADPDIVFAGKADGVYRSTDGGTNWTATGLTSVRAIVIDPSAAETVYAGTPSGVYVSASGGGGWTAMNDGLEYPAVTDLAISADHYLIASTYGAGMYRWHITTGINELITTSGSAILTAFPNPARGRVTFGIGHGAPLRGSGASLQDFQIEGKEMYIYDMAGKLVKDLSSLVLCQSAIISWDGIDQTGNTVPSGVYFCHLSAGGLNHITKFIFLQ
jgi:hypothetical protein